MQNTCPHLNVGKGEGEAGGGRGRVGESSFAIASQHQSSVYLINSYWKAFKLLLFLQLTLGSIFRQVKSCGVLMRWGWGAVPQTEVAEIGPCCSHGPSAVDLPHGVLSSLWNILFSSTRLTMCKSPHRKNLTQRQGSLFFTSCWLFAAAVVWAWPRKPG